MQLACARIGAVHSVVFAGFSAESLGSRILDSKPRVVVTATGSKRGPKVGTERLGCMHASLQWGAHMRHAVTGVCTGALFCGLKPHFLLSLPASANPDDPTEADR